MQLAPSLHRLGSSLVNSYLVEDSGREAGSVVRDRSDAVRVAGDDDRGAAALGDVEVVERDAGGEREECGRAGHSRGMYL